MTKRRYREHIGPKFSEGARLLWLAVATRGGDREALARELKIDRSMMFRYLYGDAQPEREPAGRMAELLGIGVLLWDDKPRKPFRVPMVATAMPPKKARETAKRTGTG